MNKHCIYKEDSWRKSDCPYEAEYNIERPKLEELVKLVVGSSAEVSCVVRYENYKGSPSGWRCEMHFRWPRDKSVAGFRLTGFSTQTKDVYEDSHKAKCEAIRDARITFKSMLRNP